MSSVVPVFLPPMLAVYGEPFDSDAHWFEPKWDGLRCLVHGADAIRLHSRSGRDISGNFPEITGERLFESPDYLLDGELICLGPDGTPSFDRVRDRMLLRDARRISQAAKEHPAVFVAFDILYARGKPLLDLPLQERRSALEEGFVRSQRAVLSPVTHREGRALFDAVACQGLEGIIAKERQSLYRPGRRSRAWIKVRRTRTGTFWVIGYATRDGRELRSVAVAEAGTAGPKYTGHVGSGLSQTLRQDLLRLLRQMPEVTPDQYGVTYEARRHTTWVEPLLQVRVEYLEKGANGHLRHPVFQGIVAPEKVT